MATQRYVAMLIVTLSLTGCISQFEVCPRDSETFTPVKPVWGCEKIPVYWRSTKNDATAPTASGRMHESIGFVRGEADVLTNGMHYEFIELQMKRAAAMLDGDAVIDARQTHFFGPAPVAAFVGDVVKWRD